MPGSGYGGFFGTFFGDELVNATQSGAISEARLSDMAIRSLMPFFQLGQDKDYPETSFDQASLDTNSRWGNKHVDVQVNFLSACSSSSFPLSVQH